MTYRCKNSSLLSIKAISVPADESMTYFTPCCFKTVATLKNNSLGSLSRESVKNAAKLPNSLQASLDFGITK